MNQDNVIYTEELLDFEIVEDFLPSPEKLKKAKIRIISPDDSSEFLMPEKEVQNAQYL